MPNGVYSYLQYVRFKDIKNWSVSHILGMNMGYNERYPLVSIGQIITKSIKPIEIEDNISYKQITLKTNGGGAVLRDVKQGNKIGTKKQYLVSAGQFIMSKIDARNGAFGVVGTDLDGAVVTADFPVFDVDKRMHTARLFSTNIFYSSICPIRSKLQQGNNQQTENRCQSVFVTKNPLAHT